MDGSAAATALLLVLSRSPRRSGAMHLYALCGGWGIGQQTQLLVQSGKWGGGQRLCKAFGEHVCYGYMFEVDRLLLGLVGMVMVPHVYERSALRWAVVLCNLYC